MALVAIRGRLRNIKAADPERWGRPRGAEELVERRTRGSKTFRNPDGSFTTICGGEMHTEAEPGGGWWEEARFRQGEQGGVWVQDTPRATIRLGARFVEVLDPATGHGVAWQTPPLTRERNTAWYERDGLVWRYQARRRGLKLSAVVGERRGAQTYRFRFTSRGGAGNPGLDGDGNIVLGRMRIPIPTLFTADGRVLPLTWDLRALVGGWEAAFTVDDTDLPAEAFPYEIDPTSTVGMASGTDDGYVSNTGTYGSDLYASKSTDTSATTLVAQISNSPGANPVRQIVARWDTSALPSNAQVTAANLKAYVTTKTDHDGRRLWVEWLALDGLQQWPINIYHFTLTPGTSAANVTLASLTTSAVNTIALTTPELFLNYAGYTALRLAISNSTTPTGTSNVTIAAYEDASNPEMQLEITYTLAEGGRSISAAYKAAMTSGGTGSSDLKPGLDGATARRVTLRFPLWGEFPPLATITKVELRGTVTVAGNASGTWSIHPYASNADPEQDAFATQYTSSASATAWVTGDTTFRTAANFTIDLSANAITAVQAALVPEKGYIGIGIKEEGDNHAPPTITNPVLVVYYKPPLPTRRPLTDVVQVQVFTATVPPTVNLLDVSDYALEATIAWQRPGAVRLTMPQQYLLDVTGAADVQTAVPFMSLFHVRLLGHGVVTAFCESRPRQRTVDTGATGHLVRFGGQSLHRLFGNRVTGPFPSSYDFEAGSLSGASSDSETVTAGDASPRGSSFGAASTTAEAILRKLLRTHTADAAAARKTAWTNNITYAPDNRRGASPIEVVTTREVLIDVAQKVCESADCGYGLWLGDDGAFYWHFLPGVDRTAGEGAWFISSDLTPGVEDIEVNEDITDLVTHAYVLSAPTAGTNTRPLSVRKQDGAEVYDRREAYVDGGSASTANLVATIGDAFLAQHAVKREVTLSLSSLLEAGFLTAWNVGDKITVVDSATGISSKVRVYEVTITIGTEQGIAALFDEPSEAGTLIAAAKAIQGKDYTAEEIARAREVLGLATIRTSPAPGFRGRSWKALPGGDTRDYGVVV